MRTVRKCEGPAKTGYMVFFQKIITNIVCEIVLSNFWFNATYAASLFSGLVVGSHLQCIILLSLLLTQEIFIMI